MFEQNLEKNRDAEQTKENDPIIIRKRISSTTYEVSVYFSRISRETLADKILRMARNEARWK